MTTTSATARSYTGDRFPPVIISHTDVEPDGMVLATCAGLKLR